MFMIDLSDMYMYMNSFDYYCYWWICINVYDSNRLLIVHVCT